MEVIVFCGSKEKPRLARAYVPFPTAAVGLMIAPLMILQEMKLIVCAVLDRRYAEGESKTSKLATADGRITALVLDCQGQRDVCVANKRIRLC
jgi:predicted Na+-dependent transporter